MIGQIYGIECLINHKIYIGQTIRDVMTRFKEHSRTDSLIGRAIRKYGEKSFVVVTLEECETLEKLSEREIYWIAKLNCKIPFGYNQTDGGEGILNPSEETRAKISKSCKGRKVSDETRKKISIARKGRKHSLEHCAKISMAQKGRKGKIPSPETRAKMSISHMGNKSHLGRKFSAEHLSNLSKAKIGNKNSVGNKNFLGHRHSEETKRKLSEINKGKKKSAETRLKMSESHKAYWANKHNQKN